MSPESTLSEESETLLEAELPGLAEQDLAQNGGLDHYDFALDLSQATNVAVVLVDISRELDFEQAVSAVREARNTLEEAKIPHSILLFNESAYTLTAMTERVNDQMFEQRIANFFDPTLPSQGCLDANLSGALDWTTRIFSITDAPQQSVFIITNQNDLLNGIEDNQELEGRTLELLDYSSSTNLAERVRETVRPQDRLY